MDFETFKNGGFTSGSFLNFTPAVAYKKLMETGCFLLDVREKSLTAYKCFDVPKVIYLPCSELSQRLNELSAEEFYIVADSTGLRSHESMEILSRAGFKHIANLAGGIVEWERDEFPLQINTSEQLDGSCMCQLRPRMRLKKR
ncbi:MAG TPA: hypothetical protein PK990_10335 [Salinivirgaceae bacterium]|nr:hypothetical protein [Salinivirgaceae bacterium]